MTDILVETNSDAYGGCGHRRHQREHEIRGFETLAPLGQIEIYAALTLPHEYYRRHDLPPGRSTAYTSEQCRRSR